MKQEKVGTSAPKNAGPGLLGGSPNYVAPRGANLNMKAALNATAPSGVRILKDREVGYLIGNPQVIVERRKGRAFVSVRPRPWGWSNLDREFLNPGSPGVDRYALKLLARIREAGMKRKAEIERKAELRLLERIERA